MRALLFGAHAQDLKAEIAKWPAFTLVDVDPDVVICYGGDGTLLTAEARWPGVPKAPIKNSRRGRRCMAHAPAEVIARLAANELTRTEYVKLACSVRRGAHDQPVCLLSAMNEVNVDKGHINAAVRFRLWVNDEAYREGGEIVGDGFLISTPFGSTAYFSHITRGLLYAGLGIAFKAPAEQTNHIIVPEEAVCRIELTRGPAVLAYDNATEYVDLRAGDTLEVRRSAQPAVLYTWSAMAHPSDEF